MVCEQVPVLGALAASFDLIEDPLICGRMQISVAAVNDAAKEIYIHPCAGLNGAECRFVIAHELLHVSFAAFNTMPRTRSLSLECRVRLRHQRPVLTIEQIQSIDPKLAWRDRVILGLFTRCGLRSGEVFGLEARDVGDDCTIYAYCLN